MKKTILTGLLALSILFWCGVAFAQSKKGLQSQVDKLKVQMDRIERNRLADEADNFKFTQGGETKYERNKIYGYGEMHYTNSLDENGSKNQIDQHRFVIGVNSKLSNWIQLNAEVDYEHGAQEAEFELGYLDFRINQTFNFRAGVILAPVGLLNEFHEPNLFWSTERPQLQTKIIPTTWNGGGAGFFGSPVDGVNYRFYVMNSLQSLRPAGFGSFHLW